MNAGLFNPTPKPSFGGANIRPLVILFCLFILIICVSLTGIWFFIFNVNQGRAIASTENNVGWIKQEVSRTLITARIILDQVDKLINKGDIREVDGEDAFSFISNGLPALQMVWFTDLSGKVVFSSGAGVVRGIDHRALDYFEECLDRSGFFIGASGNFLALPTSGFIVARRVMDKQ